VAEEITKQGEEPEKVEGQVGQEEVEKTGKTALARRLDAVGWALFLIWIGLVLLMGSQASLALLGIGIIIVGVQVARVLYQLSLEGFWFVVGLLFLVGGIWQMVGAKFPLVPILLIVAGVALIVTRFLPKR
jgi:hypothetical protein